MGEVEDVDEIPAFLRKQTEPFDVEDLRRLNARRNLSEQDGKLKRSKVFPSKFAPTPVFRGQKKAGAAGDFTAEVPEPKTLTVPDFLQKDGLSVSKSVNNLKLQCAE